MQTVLSFLIPLWCGVSLIRSLVIPVKFTAKLTVRAAAGFASLWFLNTTAGFTGVYLPVNAVTVLLAGTLGLPGIGIIALLAVM